MFDSLSVLLFSPETQGTENPRVPSSILGPATIFVSTPVQPTGFFVFSPKNYPQKPPCPVSGKLSSTPKQYKVAHLLRFFGKYLCHLRFLTQCVTYYKSTLVYYNIPGSFSQAAIHTRRDANCSLFWGNQDKSNALFTIIICKVV